MSTINTFVPVAMTIATTLSQPLKSGKTEIRTEAGTPARDRGVAHRALHFELFVHKTLSAGNSRKISAIILLSSGMSSRVTERHFRVQDKER